MLLLYRRWIVPGCLRRAPRWVFLVLLLPVSISIWIVWQASSSYSHAYGMAARELSESALQFAPATISLFGLIAGAVSISVERQKHRWESLVLAQQKPSQIVHAKLAVILTYGLVCLVLPCMGLIYILYQGTLGEWAHGRTYNGRALSDALLLIRWTECLLSAELILRLVTFTLLGMAISASARRVQTSLTVSGAFVAAYAGLYQGAERIYGCYPSAYDDHLYAHLFYWPMMPGAEYSYFGSAWNLRLIADLILGVALPIVSYILLRFLSQRINRS